MICRFSITPGVVRSAYRGFSAFSVLLCGLLLGCYQPTQDQPVTTAGDVASGKAIAPGESRASEAEEAAIAAVLALVENKAEQKKVLVLGNGGHVVRVNLSNISATNNDTLAYMEAFPELEELFVARPEISDDGLKRLVGLEKLWRLELEGTAISDAGIETLLPLKSLRDISVKRYSITDQSLACFAGIDCFRKS